MDFYYEGEKQDSQEMPRILHPQRDLLGSSAYAAAVADMVGNEGMDLYAVEQVLPFVRLTWEGCYLIKQKDLALQMDLGLALHILVAAQIYMLLHHISC